jgi:hypothetical protein
MTESVCPVSLTGSKVELLMGYFEDEGSGKGESGEKMKARSSSPPEMARGGFGKEGCRVTWKIDDSWWTASYNNALHQLNVELAIVLHRTYWSVPNCCLPAAGWR